MDLSVEDLEDVENQLKQVTSTGIDQAPPGVVCDVLSILEPLRTEELQTRLCNDPNTAIQATFMKPSLIEALGATLDLTCRIRERVCAVTMNTTQVCEKETLVLQSSDVMKAILNTVVDICEFAGSKAKEVYGRGFIERLVQILGLTSISSTLEDLRQVVQTLLVLVQLCQRNQQVMTLCSKGHFCDRLLDCGDKLVQLDLLEILYRCGRHQLQHSGAITIMDGTRFDKAVTTQFNMLVRNQDQIPSSAGHLARGLHALADTLNATSQEWASVHTFKPLLSSLNNFYHPDATEKQLHGDKSSESFTVNRSSLLYTFFTAISSECECVELQMASTDVLAIELDSTPVQLSSCATSNATHPAQKLSIQLRLDPHHGVPDQHGAHTQSALGASGTLVLWLSASDVLALRRLIPTMVIKKAPKISIATLDGTRAAGNTEGLSAAGLGKESIIEANPSMPAQKTDAAQVNISVAVRAGSPSTDATVETGNHDKPPGSRSLSCVPDSQQAVNPQLMGIQETQEQTCPQSSHICNAELQSIHGRSDPLSPSCDSSSRNMERQQCQIQAVLKADQHQAGEQRQSSSNLSDIVCAQKSVSGQQGIQGEPMQLNIQDHRPKTVNGQNDQHTHIQTKETAPQVKLQEPVQHDTKQLGLYDLQLAQQDHPAGTHAEGIPSHCRMTRAMQRKLHQAKGVFSPDSRIPAPIQARSTSSQSETSENDAMLSLAEYDYGMKDTHLTSDAIKGDMGLPHGDKPSRRKGVLGKLTGRHQSKPAHPPKQAHDDPINLQECHHASTPRGAAMESQQQQVSKVEDTAMQSGHRKGKQQRGRPKGNKFLRAAAASKSHLGDLFAYQNDKKVNAKGQRRMQQQQQDLQPDEPAEQQRSPACDDLCHDSEHREHKAMLNSNEDGPQMVENGLSSNTESDQSSASDPDGDVAGAKSLNKAYTQRETIRSTAPAPEHTGDSTDDDEAGLKEQEARFHNLLCQLQSPQRHQTQDSRRMKSGAPLHVSTSRQVPAMFISQHKVLASTAIASQSNRPGGLEGTTMSEQLSMQQQCRKPDTNNARDFDDSAERNLMKNSILKLLKARQHRLDTRRQTIAKEVKSGVAKLFLEADKKIADTENCAKNAIHKEYALLQERLQSIAQEMTRVKQDFEASLKAMWMEYSQTYSRIPNVKRKAELLVEQQQKFAKMTIQSAQQKSQELLVCGESELYEETQQLTDMSDVHHCLDDCQQRIVIG